MISCITSLNICVERENEINAKFKQHVIGSEMQVSGQLVLMLKLNFRFGSEVLIKATVAEVVYRTADNAACSVEAEQLLCI